MSFGIHLPVTSPDGLATPDVVLEFARRAEAYGFDGLWAGDHLLWRAPFLDPTVTLAVISAVTTRVSLGTNVLLLALRRPVVAAKVFGTLDYISSGRLYLGVGVGGEFPSEFDAAGVPLTERGAALDKGIADLFEWWSERAPGGVAVRPAPRDDMPLWIGGRSDAALRRAVRLRARVWATHFHPPEAISASNTRLVELAEQEGATTPETGVTVNIGVTETGGVEERAFAHEHFGLPDERIGRHLVIGDVDECAERISAYREVADHVIFFPLSSRPVEHLARLAAVMDAVGRG